ESLIQPSDAALVKTVEYGHRLADHQDKISTQLEDIADLIREASYYAQEDGMEQIDSEHIQKAIQEKIYRSNLLQEKIKELIEAKTIFIDLEGTRVGQINGLSVLDIGDLAFGRPSRITASTSVGSNGIIDIEREVKMGGPIHSKGVLILTGFLFEKFGKDKPLNVSAQVVFEQSYSGVEGDSASSAELYTILSSLADLPLKQNLAVTGSVNQKGEIQAVGGINEKIEGYFEVCQAVGLTGDQGVLIPMPNVKNLMVKEEVITAVENGQFHIWAADTIEDGIEILTGKPAGIATWDPENRQIHFERDTVFDHVNQRLTEMSTILKKFGKEEE
ncbi:MAG: AAA family ATPase, partial [Saprospiraceae bacterium]|nr:AAA family ATPase [Saprospiraceae bacterium]